MLSLPIHYASASASSLTTSSTFSRHALFSPAHLCAVHSNSNSVSASTPFPRRIVIALLEPVLNLSNASTSPHRPSQRPIDTHLSPRALLTCLRTTPRAVSARGETPADDSELMRASLICALGFRLVSQSQFTGVLYLGGGEARVGENVPALLCSLFRVFSSVPASLADAGQLQRPTSLTSLAYYDDGDTRTARILTEANDTVERVQSEMVDGDGGGERDGDGDGHRALTHLSGDIDVVGDGEEEARMSLPLPHVPVDGSCACAWRWAWTYALPIILALAVGPILPSAAASYSFNFKAPCYCMRLQSLLTLSVVQFVSAARPGIAGAENSIALTGTFNTSTIAAPTCPDMSGLPYDCYPMLASAGQLGAFLQVADQLNSDYYMGYNECNEAGECDMSPGEAFSIWAEAMEPLRNAGKKLVCPVTSSAPSGTTWERQFFQFCGANCCDVMPLHWFGTEIEEFMQYVESWHAMYPTLPIWITEFGYEDFNGGSAPTLAELEAWFQQAISWINQQSYIDIYFPPIEGDIFPLLNSDLSLTALGHIAFGF
ncbi:glycosyl hydrolase catalytic core-domain-containing protein [Mycena leptocephala]|nr:glycosyl hydrolase catalytic core-domain-containing protein [Mycena leptocephala]